MKIYRLKTTHNLPISQGEAWDFLSDPINLKLITPDYMDFKIINDVSKNMYAGQIIQYIVRPIMGIPIKWITEITHVDRENYFVDEQRFGPYSLWHHKHFLKPIKNGVEIIDIIDYKMPMGLLGRIVHPILVAPKLKEIFNYRKKVLTEIFGAIS